jgi:hypothetical protein
LLLTERLCILFRKLMERVSVMSAMDVSDLELGEQLSVDGAGGFSTAMLLDGCSRGC